MPVPKNVKKLRHCIGMFAYYAKWICDFTTNQTSYWQRCKVSSTHRSRKSIWKLEKWALRFLLRTNRWGRTFSSGVRCFQRGNCCRPQPTRKTCRFHVQVVEEVWKSLSSSGKRSDSYHWGCSQMGSFSTCSALHPDHRPVSAAVHARLCQTGKKTQNTIVESGSGLLATQSSKDPA